MTDITKKWLDSVSKFPNATINVQAKELKSIIDQLDDFKAKCARYEEALKAYANEEDWWVPDYGNNKSCAFDYVGENREFEGHGYELAQKAIKGDG